MPNVNEQTIYQAGGALATLAQQATARGALGVAVPGEYISVAASVVEFEESFGPAPLVKFATAYQRPVRSLTIDLTPIQSGTGEPSPDNVRPISGRTEVNAYVSPTQDVADATTYPVTWQTEAGTVYAGYVDVVTGVLTVTMAGVDLGTLDWSYSSAYNRFSTSSLSSVIKQNGIPRSMFMYCSCYQVIDDGRSVTDVPDGSIYNGGTSSLIYAHDQRVTTPSAFKAAVTGQILVYPLETPIIYQLDPQTVQTLVGQNVVWSDGGPVTVEL